MLERHLHMVARGGANVVPNHFLLARELHRSRMQPAALSGPKDKDWLKSIASAAYDQLENRVPAPTRSGAAGQLMSRRES